MKKSLAEIMNEPANVEEIIQKANEINERLNEVENMPELEVVTFNDTEDDANR